LFYVICSKYVCTESFLLHFLSDFRSFKKLLIQT
jgi:hypothetical protein